MRTPLSAPGWLAKALSKIAPAGEVRLGANSQGTYAILHLEQDVASSCQAYTTDSKLVLPDLPAVANFHITLATFAPQHDVRSVRALVTRWAKAQAPFEVSLIGLGSFDHPHQVIYAQLEKSPALEAAVRSLRTLRTSLSLTPSPSEFSIASWQPHVSLVRATGLSASSWEVVKRTLAPLVITPAVESVREVFLSQVVSGQVSYVARLPLVGKPRTARK